MATERRTTEDRGKNSPGIYLGKVVNHLDQRFMGGIEVEILKNSESGNLKEYVQCKYASPFYGQTPYTGLTRNNGYANTQKSYGFWAIPPDIGVQVIVVMPEGDYSQAYWIGCVPDSGMNFMTPGYSGTTYNDADPSRALPVGEYNKRSTQFAGQDPTQIIKPVNTEAQEQLERAGLDRDHVRGTNTSSGRREAPSMVFGISTPGPPDRQGPTHRYGPSGAAEANMPYNRLGGSSFVMDDGDMSLLRKAAPTEEAPDYATPESGDPTGDPKRPANELIRLRTRSGHQILLHNTEDLIYISHGSGNSWIEMTGNGKIDIYAKDSISVHSENDINFDAGRDINFSAVEDINIIADKDIKMHSFENTTHQAKNYKMDVEENSDIRVEKDLKTRVQGEQHLYVNSNMFIAVKGNMDTKVDLKSVLEANEISEKAVVDHTLGSNETYINGNLQVSANIDTGTLLAGNINGTAAGTPWSDQGPGDDQILGAYSFGFRGADPLTAEPTKEAAEFTDDDFAFYPKRVPKHESWKEHEHLDPQAYVPDETQSTEKERKAEEEEQFQFPPIADTFKKG